MNTKNEIISFLKNNKSFLEDRYHLSKIGLFGSFARDEMTPKSDVDIIIELREGTKNIHELKTSLKEFLSSQFGRSVDLAREKYLKPYAKDQILKDTLYV